MSDVITGIVPSTSRRFFGVGVLYLLGAMLIYICAVQPPQGLHLLFLLLVLGGFALFGGWRMWQATAHVIELTQDELRLSDGTVIARVEDIAKVDRSFFAFKPSNGFLVALNTRYPASWMPGLYWRFGKRVGVGGLTRASQGKQMADMLAALLAKRDGLI